jgi:hypothetical protein
MARRILTGAGAAAPVPSRLPLLVGGPSGRKPDVAMRCDGLLILTRPTYAGRTWRGRSVGSLLLRSRMVPGVFDDLKPETRSKWIHADVGGRGLE